MNLIRLSAIALLLINVPLAFALPDGENCEQDPFWPTVECIDLGEEGLDPSEPVPPSNGAPTSPPATTLPAQIYTSAHAMSQLHLLADYYVGEVIAASAGEYLTPAEVNAELSPLAQAEYLPPSIAIWPADRIFLRYKLRLLKANHAQFASHAVLPSQFLALLERLGELDIQERGLETIQ